MLSKQEYISVSVEVNLFFMRIMKEHLFFIETALQPIQTNFIVEASRLKRNFEQLLNETVYYANGVVPENIIKSNEFVTPYTLKAEELSSMLTGANINTSITRKEYELKSDPNIDYKDSLEKAFDNINRRAYSVVQEVISLKKRLLALQLECRIFITLYPELIEHITREAVYYMETLKSLLDRNLPKRGLCDELNFWNTIMGEHAQFIDGLLDPTEKNLKAIAQRTANNFEKLVEECVKTSESLIIQKSLESTEAIRGFKRSATEGLLKCEIRSIALPLLGDHVLREANHFLRVLKTMKK